jgi:hypothetical protein
MMHRVITNTVAFELNSLVNAWISNNVIANAEKGGLNVVFF